MAESVADPYPPGVAPPWTQAGFEDPRSWLTTMLRERPVAFDSEIGMWHVFRYEDVHAFLKHPDRWSTAKRLELVPPDQRVIRLLTSDPPEHAPLRACFSHSYRPRRVARLEERVHQECRQLLRRGLDQGCLDVVGEFAEPLTLAMICELVGVPPSERDALKGSGTKVLGELVRPDDPDSRMQLFMGADLSEEKSRTDAYFAELIERRRREPQDDLVSDLARIEAVPVPGQFDLGALLLEQIAAGQNTTVHLIGTMIASLLAHPDQLARLRAEPDLVPAAVEESLRYTSPLQARPRISARPTSAGGVEIPEGVQGLAWIQAANLDPDVFRDPLRFDIERSPNHHVAFGYGEHFCLGAALARMEARVALREWLRLLGDCAPARPAAPDWLPDFLMRGLASFPVELRPA